ncbi:MAG: hypothetical protein ABIP20_16195 [Chthoniobacteraceae bacterium]
MGLHLVPFGARAHIGVECQREAFDFGGLLAETGFECGPFRGKLCGVRVAFDRDGIDPVLHRRGRNLRSVRVVFAHGLFSGLAGIDRLGELVFEVGGSLLQLNDLVGHPVARLAKGIELHGEFAVTLFSRGGKFLPGLCDCLPCGIEAFLSLIALFLEPIALVGGQILQPSGFCDSLLRFLEQPLSLFAVTRSGVLLARGSVPGILGDLQPLFQFGDRTAVVRLLFAQRVPFPGERLELPSLMGDRVEFFLKLKQFAPQLVALFFRQLLATAGFPGRASQSLDEIPDFAGRVAALREKVRRQGRDWGQIVTDAGEFCNFVGSVGHDTGPQLGNEAICQFSSKPRAAGSD